MSKVHYIILQNSFLSKRNDSNWLIGGIWSSEINSRAFNCLVVLFDEILVNLKYSRKNLGQYVEKLLSYRIYCAQSCSEASEINCGSITINEQNLAESCKVLKSTAMIDSFDL